jgi:hypothetical protein
VRDSDLALLSNTNTHAARTRTGARARRVNALADKLKLGACVRRNRLSRLSRARALKEVADASPPQTLTRGERNRRVKLPKFWAPDGLEPWRTASSPERLWLASAAQYPARSVQAYELLARHAFPGRIPCARVLRQCANRGSSSGEQDRAGAGRSPWKLWTIGRQSRRA